MNRCLDNINTAQLILASPPVANPLEKSERLVRVLRLLDHYISDHSFLKFALDDKK